MRNFKQILLAVLSLMGYTAVAQINVGIESNSQYYIDDPQIKITDQEVKDNPFRSNNYVKIDYFKGKFEAGLQMEGYLPYAILNYSPHLEGVNVGTIYARYNDFENGIDVTVGHFYEQFGSGLVLRSWEDRALGINNSIFGGRVKYKPHSSTQITLLGGKQRVGMGFDLSEGMVYGADAEVDLSSLMDKDYYLKFGASFVGRHQDLEQMPDVEPNTNMLSTRLEYAGDKFLIGGEYVYKTEDIVATPEGLYPQYQKGGNAFLLNLGYNVSGFGVNVNLRRMENMDFYSDRHLQGNTFNYGMINYVPALTKQYDFALQNIYIYQAQGKYDIFNLYKLGEIGGQFDVFYEAKEGTFFGGKHGGNFILNGSYWAGLKSEIQDDRSLKSTGFFDGGEKYYSDIGLEYRRKWSERFSSIFMYLNQYYNQGYLEEKNNGFVKANTVAVEGLYFLKPTSSIRMELQHQWADAYHKNWAGATLEYSPNSNFSVFAHDIYNYGNDKNSKRIHYFSFGASYAKGRTRVAASYGRQRGGLICVGGVCREVPEANGITLNITTNF